MTTKFKEENNCDDELTPPEWLNNDFLTKVFNKTNKNVNNTIILSFKITPAVGKNDHFASVMFRAQVTYRFNGNNENQIKSIIIKTMPEEDGFKKQFLEQTNIFETEIGIYTEVLPRFEKYLRDIGDETKLMASVLYHEMSPRKIIVFEDMVSLGYATLPYGTLNREELKAIYTKIAKWHAISYKMIKEEPNLFNKYRTTIFTQKTFEENPFAIHSLRLFMDLLKKTSELQKYVQYFDKLIKKIDLFKECENMHNEYWNECRDDTYYVLNHGDFHVKNIMFQYNSITNKLEDIMLLDFQYCHVGTIANDLLYSIYMILDKNSRSNASEFLNYYFKIFKETIEKIGINGPLPKEDDFNEQINRYKYSSILMMIGVLPIGPIIVQGNFSIDKWIQSEEYRQKIFGRREYVDQLLLLIPKYIELGSFDD